MALEARAVVAHDATALGLGKIVGETGAPEEADVREEEVDGLGDKGVDEEAVVLLGLGETHFVHVVPTAEEAALDPSDEETEEAVAIRAQRGKGENDLLDENAGKDGLVHEDRGEDFPVPGQQFLEEGGPAAGRGDDKDGATDLLPAECGKENVIQGPSGRDHHPKQREEQEKEKGDQPAS